MSLDPKPVDLKELQKKQLSGKDLNTATGNVDKSYKYPAHESHLMHLRLTKKTNNPATKSYDVSERIEKLNVDQYQRMAQKRNNSFAEYDQVDILHDPRPKAEIEEFEDDEDAGQNDPSAAKKPMRSMQDAQKRYLEVFGVDAPGDTSFTELKRLIEEKEQTTA